jgi:hypothetical protein
MSIEALYADGIEASIQRDLANPAREAPPSFAVGSFLSSGVKGIPAAGLEVGGSALDILSPAAIEVARRPRLKVQENQPDNSEQIRSTAKFVSEGGMVMRAKAEEFAPDPTTAHTADQMLFGITRLGAKVAAATTVGNLPTAAALIMAEETNTAYQALRAKGIDHETALKTAAVQGAGGAAAVIPLAGPGAYVAQEQLSKKILEQAGYHDEASRHDPLDPLGLSLSIALPGVFGGAHIAGLSRRAKPQPIGPVRTEADAADAVKLTPEEQRMSDEFERSAGNLKELRAAIEAEKNPANKAILQQELDVQTAAAAAHIESTVIERSGVDPVAVDAARTRVTSDALYRSMPEELDAPQAVMQASDSIASGVFPDVEPLTMESRLLQKLKDHDAAVAEYAIRPDAEGGKVLNTDVARELSPDYLADRTKSADVHEPASAFIKRVYAERLAEIKPGDQVMFTSGGTGAGKTSAISALASMRAMKDDAAIVYDTNMNTMSSAVRKIEQALTAGANVRIVHVQRDPVDALVHGALPRAVRQEKEFGSGRTVPLKEHARTHRGAAQVILKLADKYKNDPRVDIQVIDNTRGKNGQQVTDLGFVRGFDYTGLEGKLNEALKQQYESGAISQAIFRGTEGHPSAGVRPLVRGNDGAEPARADGGNALPDASSAELSAGSPKAPKENAQSGQDAQRAEAIVSETPDMKVQLPGSDETLTAAKAMERAKAEHAEELGDNDLVKAAFECALSYGA